MLRFFLEDTFCWTSFSYFFPLLNISFIVHYAQSDCCVNSCTFWQKRADPHIQLCDLLLCSPTNYL